MGCIANDQVFDPAEKHFHKNGLRTRPSTKYTAENNSEKSNKNNEDENAYTENKKVLRPEDHPEQDEFAFKNIKKKKRFSIILKKRQSKKNNEIYITKIFTVF